MIHLVDKAKFLSLADTLEATHSVIDPMQQRLLESQRLVRAASKLFKHLDFHDADIDFSSKPRFLPVGSKRAKACSPTLMIPISVISFFV